MPLLVTLTWLSRKALLLFGSSHDNVQGAKVAYIALAYSSALMVSGLSITTLLRVSTSWPPCDQISQLVHRPSPVALPSAKPPGVPLAFNACSIFRKPSVSWEKTPNPPAFGWLCR